MIEPTAESRNVILFGPFSLDAGRRLLLEGRRALRFGGTHARHVDRFGLTTGQGHQQTRPHGKVTGPTSSSKKGVSASTSPRCARLWGRARTVRGASPALAGRGYSFVAPISRFSIDDSSTSSSPRTIAYRRPNMPNPLPRMVGRADGVRLLLAQLCRQSLLLQSWALGVSARPRVAGRGRPRTDRGVVRRGARSSTLSLGGSQPSWRTRLPLCWGLTVRSDRSRRRLGCAPERQAGSADPRTIASI